MVGKVYFLADKRVHEVSSQDFQAICELHLGEEPGSYLVIAEGDLRSAEGSSGSMDFGIRLEVLSKSSMLIGTDEVRFNLDGVDSTLVITSPAGTLFRHGILSRHISLMAAAKVPAEGGGGPPPRAILSARGRRPPGGLLENVRIAAFPADEIVGVTIQGGAGSFSG
jgi:hypothetical protein